MIHIVTYTGYAPDCNSNTIHQVLYGHTQKARDSLERASECDQEIPQSNTADKPQHREEEQKNINSNTT